MLQKKRKGSTICHRFPSGDMIDSFGNSSKFQNLSRCICIEWVDTKLHIETSTFFGALIFPVAIQPNWVFCNNKWLLALSCPTYNNLQKISAPNNISILLKLSKLGWASLIPLGMWNPFFLYDTTGCESVIFSSTKHSIIAVNALNLSSYGSFYLYQRSWTTYVRQF